MSTTLLRQAEAKLEEIVARYNLTRYFDTDEFTTTRDLFLAATADNALHIWNWARSNRPRAVVAFQQGEEKDLIYAFDTIKTNAGPRMAVGTRSGKLYLLDGRAEVQWETKVSEASIWYVTSARFGGEIYLFVCSVDRTIRIFDLLGRLRCTVQTPGKLLSLDVRTIGERTLLASGTQERNWVYIWQLEEMLARQSGVPSYVLTGGQKPAFCAKFVELAGEVYVTHSSWDGHCYLYRLKTLRKRMQNKPSLMLDGDCPLYTVAGAEIDGQSVILAGSALGHLYGWAVRDTEVGPRHLVAHWGARIRAMRGVRVEGQVKLFVGGNDGRVYLFELGQLEDGMQPVQVLQTEGGDVTGVGVF